MSLFRNSSPGLPDLRDLEDYCIVALLTNTTPITNRGATLVGARAAADTLVVLNYSNVHFDPCLPFAPG